MQKYNLFYNEAILSVIIYNVNQLADLQKNNAVLFEENKFLGAKMKLFLEEQQSFSLYCLKNNLEKTLAYLKTFFIVERAAGGIVVNNENKILVIKRFCFLDFPKGHIEKNEKIETAAIREVEEETNISNLQIINKLDNTYHIFSDKNKLILKETMWFYMKTTSINKLVPQIEENITDVYWMLLTEIDTNLHFFYPSLQELIVKFKKQYRYYF